MVYGSMCEYNKCPRCGLAYSNRGMATQRDKTGFAIACCRVKHRGCGHIYGVGDDGRSHELTAKEREYLSEPTRRAYAEAELQLARQEYWG